MTPTPTILSIGDTVVDAFIELQDAHVTCAIDSSQCEICMKFADKIPYANDYVLYGVGNSANAAVSSSRLGLQTHFLTHLGQDDNGQKSIDSLARDGVHTELCLREPNVKTNYHYVLWYRPERTILVKHEHYNYDFPAEIARFTTAVDWVYLSSMGSGTEQYHRDIITWLHDNSSIKLAYQPGTFQMKLDDSISDGIYARSELFFCNVEEAERILKQEPKEHTVEHLKDLLSRMHEKGPKVVCITDGPKGSYCYDGAHYYYMPIYPDPQEPLERTGAGDAFASAFTALYAQGYPIQDCMMRAPINSMNVVQHVGAQEGLLTNDELNSFLQIAPSTYVLSEI